MSITETLHDFFRYLAQNEIEIYNEIGLQCELAMYLKDRLKPVEVKLEYPRDRILRMDKNDSLRSETLKGITKEFADIYIRTADECYVIELKMPKSENHAIPHVKLSAVEDVLFLQELFDQQNDESRIAACYAVFLTDDKRFSTDYKGKGCQVHKYFDHNWVFIRKLPPFEITYENDIRLTALNQKILREYRAEWMGIVLNHRQSHYYVMELT